MVYQTLINMAKRVPLIQFRKGGLANKGVAATIGQGPASASQASSKSAAKKSASSPAIEDWELPARFARKPIDPEEMEYINNGGSPK